jgi:hypothetical protein
MKEDPTQENKPRETMMKIQVTAVTNGYLTEVASSTEPEHDAQERVAVHKSLNDLLSYLKLKFAQPTTF